jgi:hypothetical protein
VIDELSQIMLPWVMTRQILFSALLVVSSGYAFVKGGRPEQIGAATLLGGAGLSVLAASPAIHRFENVETGILLTDLAILGIFLWLSLRSNRFWPMWVAAMLADEVIVHVMLQTVPNVVPRAYMHAIAVWSWLAQIVLIAATWRHQDRLKRRGADAPWKS